MNQARAAFIVTPDAEDDSRLLLVPSKMNIAPMRHGLAYRLEGVTVEADGQTILTSRVAWESQPVTITADQALAALAVGSEEVSALAEAKAFLTELLADGPMLKKRVEKAAEDAGIAWRTVRRAKERLGIQPRKDGMEGGWKWDLPKVSNGAEDAHQKNMGTFELNGHLRSNGCNGSSALEVGDSLEIPKFLDRRAELN